MAPYFTIEEYEPRRICANEGISRTAQRKKVNKTLRPLRPCEKEFLCVLSAFARNKSLYLHPTLNSKPLYTSEFPQIIRYQDESLRFGMCRN